MIGLYLSIVYGEGLTRRDKAYSKIPVQRVIPLSQDVERERGRGTELFFMLP